MCLVSQGNGKTVRTERAMAVFPPNWVTAGGPASARAGMNGTLPPTQTCYALFRVYCLMYPCQGVTSYLAVCVPL